MADIQDNDFSREESAAPDSRLSSDKMKGGKKKKKKKGRGCGFFILLLILAVGAAGGIQLSGQYDFRNYVYPVVPMLPLIGPELAKFIPEEYTLTATERRTKELGEWEASIADKTRQQAAFQKSLDLVSKDLGVKEKDLTYAQEELAAMLEALSDDMAANTSEPAASEREEIAGIIATFEEMNSRNSAAILEKLNPRLAVAVLDGLTEDVRADTLRRMDASLAAGLMEQLTELQKSRNRAK
ncbi:MAG: hypothetical protein LBT08_08445 [Synergistaceae bacterium]|jgi:flagellar motility protein MotE (MotC chaperone)|nr:hypothetical protein [Synergistaceae bacterium]